MSCFAAAAAVAMACSCASCRSAKKAQSADEADTVALAGPAFSADSAYAFTAAQCAFGPRTMNSTAHDRCGEWIMGKFADYGMAVTTQDTDVKGYDGTTLRCRNIIARYRPEAAVRVLVCAHWDSRPWADNDPDSANWRKPVMAANDGASGVAVMLEVARLLKADTTASVGVDFVCFDAEDWGTPQWSDMPDEADSWALGAQHWAANVPDAGKPVCGILLDMVGAQGAKFYQEGVSKQYAAELLNRVWRTASQIGYGSYFPMSDGGMITDDHVPVNEKAGIPCIDIIPFFPDCPQSSFGPTWHTVSDDLAHIDRNSLKAVGQVLVQMLWGDGFAGM